MQTTDLAQNPFQKPVRHGRFMASIRIGFHRLMLAGAVIAAPVTGAMAQESGMPTQSGGQEPEMPGNPTNPTNPAGPTPGSPKPAAPGNGSPQTLEAEENGVKLQVTCAENQPAKDCAVAAAKMLQRWQGE